MIFKSTACPDVLGNQTLRYCGNPYTLVTERLVSSTRSRVLCACTLVLLHLSMSLGHFGMTKARMWAESSQGIFCLSFMCVFPLKVPSISHTISLSHSQHFVFWKRHVPQAQRILLSYFCPILKKGSRGQCCVRILLACLSYLPVTYWSVTLVKLVSIASFRILISTVGITTSHYVARM